MSHSMKTFLLFQVSLVLCVLSQSTQFFIDQSTSTLLSQQDGSQQNPFSSLAAAFKAATSKSAEITFMGESYTVNSKEAFNTGSRKQIVLTVKAPEGFMLHFEDPGQIICNNYAQYINEDPVKNVNISFSGITIDGNSSKAMFYGSCYFRFENIYIDELPTTFLTTTNEGSALLRNFTINDIRLRDDQNLIDQDSRQRIEADYLILDSVSMKNTRANSKGEVYAVIMSNLQYSLIQVKDSELMGIGFKIKGEQIGGNNKTDIYMSNSVMSNAENFFFIESYGTVLIEDSVFTNASNRAVFFFLVDENLSPILGTFKNCLFSNNAVRFAGGALTYQGSKETNYQLFMNAIITGCSFINNAASFSGGALALLFFQNANVTVENSNFSSNTAVEAGGAIYVDKGESTLIMTVRNSVFDSNSAFSGGVFSFDFLNGAHIILENNVYTRNSAKLEGGIGYVSESSLTLTDTNSYASSNKAHFQAGAWSLESDSNVTFQNVSFTETKAFLRGGCITNSGASLTLNQTSFSNCTLSAVASAGGALFVGQDAVVKVYNSDFTNNLAEFGASFSIQSTRKESQVFDGITISSELKRISKDAPTIKSQICSGPGDLTLQSMVVPSLQSPFLLQQEGKVLIQNVVLQDITCDAQDDSLYFCLFDVQQTDSALTVENFELGNASSSVPLLVSRGGSASLTSVKIDQMSMPSDVAVWDIRDSVLKVQNMEINNLDKNFVRSVNSDMSVENSNFEAQGRGTASDTGEQASNEYDLVAKSG